MATDADAAPAAAPTLRLFVGPLAPGEAAVALTPGAVFDLPGTAAAHVKVRRLQPGATVRLFDGAGSGDWPAVVEAIGRAAVRVRVGAAPLGEGADSGQAAGAAAESPVAVTLAFGMPANERVDGLVEKATELGVHALVPLMSERSVLRLAGERAERRRAHWQAVAAAACEQCGRARVPRVHAVQPLAAWLQALRREGGDGADWRGGDGSGDRSGHAQDDPAGPAALRWLLATDPEAPPLGRAFGPASSPAAPWPPHAIVVLSGPEGGLAAGETAAALAAGFTAVSLGPRILRADTAPLAVLAWLGIALAQRPRPEAGA